MVRQSDSQTLHPYPPSLSRTHSLLKTCSRGALGMKLKVEVEAYIRKMSLTIRISLGDCSLQYLPLIRTSATVFYQAIKYFQL